MTEPHGYQRFLAELKRRKVFRLAALYGGAGFVAVQAADVFVPALGLPPWILRAIASSLAPARPGVALRRAA